MFCSAKLTLKPEEELRDLMWGPDLLITQRLGDGGACERRIA